MDYGAAQEWLNPGEADARRDRMDYRRGGGFGPTRADHLDADDRGRALALDMLRDIPEPLPDSGATLQYRRRCGYYVGDGYVLLASRADGTRLEAKTRGSSAMGIACTIEIVQPSSCTRLGAAFSVRLERAAVEPSEGGLREAAQLLLADTVAAALAAAVK